MQPGAEIFIHGLREQEHSRDRPERQLQRDAARRKRVRCQYRRKGKRQCRSAVVYPAEHRCEHQEAYHDAGPDRRQRRANHNDEQPYKSYAEKRRSAVFAQNALQYADEKGDVHARYGDDVSKPRDVH